MLAGLLLPDVQKVRASAQRVRCQNSLKQISPALVNYHLTYRRFMPGSGPLDSPYGPDSSDVIDRRRWHDLLLPYIDQGPLYQSMQDWLARPTGPVLFKYANGWSGRFTPIPLLFCLVDPNSPKLNSIPSDQQGIHSNYVACAGSTYFNPPSGPPSTDLNGIFYSLSMTALSDISDGASNMLLVSEINVSPDVTGHGTRGRIDNPAMCHRPRLCCLGLLLLLTSGCDGTPRTYSVSGQVTLDGDAIPEGHILFILEDRALRTEGGPIRRGAFSFPARGGKRVEITATRPGPHARTSMGPGYVDYIPERYNVRSALSVEVTPEGKKEFGSIRVLCG